MLVGDAYRAEQQRIHKIAIVGPTAVGKTAVAIAVARQISAEIISADSMQIWRGLDIGTAKPSAAEQAECRFHLLDVADYTARFSVVDFQRLAQDAESGIVRRGACPILCGGTGLYVRAVVDGLSFPPGGDESVRDRLKQIADVEGADALHRKLSALDSKTAERLAPADTKRVIRALEVWEISGKTLSSFLEEDAARRAATDWLLFGLACDHDVLVERICNRIDIMVQQGLEQEIRLLYANGFRQGLQSCSALGYQEMVDYIDGRLTLDEAVAKIKLNTRRFAKRQRTWFLSLIHI